MLAAQPPTQHRKLIEAHRFAAAVLDGRTTTAAAMRALAPISGEDDPIAARSAAVRLLTAALADLEQRRAETVASMHRAAARAYAADAPRSGVVVAMLRAATTAENGLPPETIRRVIADAERRYRWRARWSDLRSTD